MVDEGPPRRHDGFLMRVDGRVGAPPLFVRVAVGPVATSTFVGTSRVDRGYTGPCHGKEEACANQIPLRYIIGYNILRYQALPWHISYQENV